MRPIFSTTYKGKKQVEIYMLALHHELVLFQQSRNCFFMYWRVRLKGSSWAGPRISVGTPIILIRHIF